MSIEAWPLVEPFKITGRTWETLEVVLVRIEADGLVGRGEAAGVYFRGETATSMIAQIESIRGAIERGIDRTALQHAFPVGGALNAVDCALWDLEAKVTGRPVWQLAGLDVPKALLTTFGCGADTPEKMATAARAYSDARAIKLKLTGEPIDAERVLAVREARPDVWLGIDANQGFSRPFLEDLMPTLVRSRVSMIEQPFPIGQEMLLDGFHAPIPIAADESADSAAAIPALEGRFDLVNIKLDKSGGFTGALEAARACQACGMQLMVGNMLGTSLAMAPAWVFGQLCQIVDLDGPLFLKGDRAKPARYHQGLIECPRDLWGWP